MDNNHYRGYCTWNNLHVNQIMLDNRSVCCRHCLDFCTMPAGLYTQDYVNTIPFKWLIRWSSFFLWSVFRFTVRDAWQCDRSYKSLCILKLKFIIDNRQSIRPPFVLLVGPIGRFALQLRNKVYGISWWFNYPACLLRRGAYAAIKIFLGRSNTCTPIESSSN